MKRLATRFGASSDVTDRELALPVTERGDYSGGVVYNVLEHIPDYVGGVSRAGPPGWAAVLFVPAFMFAFRTHDAQIGHQRRYSVRDPDRVFRHRPEHRAHPLR